MTTQRYKPHAAVWLIIEKDGQILLSHRHNTGWMDGHHTLVSGHLEEGENLTDAMIREAKEEANLSLTREELSVCHISHRKSSDREYIDFFFITKNTNHKPENMEPKKCKELVWFPLDNLPTNIAPNLTIMFDAIINKRYYGEFGW